MVLAKEKTNISAGRIGSPVVDPYKFNQLNTDKGAKAIQWSKDSLFNKWYYNNRISICKKMNLDTDLTLFKKD